MSFTLTNLETKPQRPVATVETFKLKTPTKTIYLEVQATITKIHPNCMREHPYSLDVKSTTRPKLKGYSDFNMGLTCDSMEEVKKRIDEHILQVVKHLQTFNRPIKVKKLDFKEVEGKDTSIVVDGVRYSNGMAWWFCEQNKLNPLRSEMAELERQLSKNWKMKTDHEIAFDKELEEKWGRPEEGNRVYSRGLSTVTLREIRELAKKNNHHPDFMALLRKCVELHLDFYKRHHIIDSKHYLYEMREEIPSDEMLLTTFPCRTDTCAGNIIKMLDWLDGKKGKLSNTANIEIDIR